MLPATVFATGETETVLKGWNIALGEDIGVKFHLNSADYTVTTTVNGAAVTPAISENVVTVNVAAAQMTDKIGLTVKNGEEIVHTGEYSVRQYAETILNGEYDDYIKDMVKEMLNYGAYAQEYFNYKPNSTLANAGYELENNASVPSEVPSVASEGSAEGVSLYGMSLVFQSKIAVRFYFVVNGNANDHTFKVGETAYKAVKKDGLYYVEVGNINPQNLDKEITVTVDDTLAVSYSPLNYIVRKYNDAASSETLKNMVQAMYGYHLEAKYYNSVVPVGALQSSGHGWSEGGIYAKMPENDAYFVQDDWGIEYTPVNADVIKLVRGGETTSVGVPGNGALIKFTSTDYYLKTENHTISGDVLPLVDQDYLIIEGRFYHPATGSVMYISKTYIYNNNGTLEFSTTEPTLPVSYDAGVLQSSVHGAGGGGIYFTTAETNDAPWGDWNTYYDTANEDCLKLVRNGQTVSVGLTGRNTICKFGANDYYLRLEEHTIGSYAPFTTDDMFIVEGAYTHKNSKTTLNIAKTYIYHDGSNWVFSDTEPVYEPETESPFTFDKGVFSADIFNNRNNGLSVSVENKQLKLQRPAGADNWLWLKQDMKAGTVITMDVTFSGEGMNIFGYGSKASGDPITTSELTDPPAWNNGQGGSGNGSYTFTIYEDCYGLSLMLGFAGSTETAIYIDNVVIKQPVETDFGYVMLPTSTDTLNIGVWNGSYHAFADKQLKELQAAGITKIMGINPAYIGTDNVSAWLDRVYSYGIRVIIDLRDWDGTTVPSYANHPGLIGFLMYDEPNANVFDDLAALKAKFDAVMPADKLFYVNLFPECAADSSLGETNWWDQLIGNNLDYDEDYVTEFLNKLDIEVLSWDNYSLLEGSGIRTEYFHNFEVMAGKNLPLWYTMLSAGHNATYATPSADELRWQMAVAMTYGVQNIDHYTYTSHEDDYSCMVEYETWNPTDLYYDIKTVNNEYLAWDHIYMAYKWQGVGAYDAGTSNAMLTMLENKLNLTNYGLTVASSNEDLLVGVFDHNGNKAYMITNAGSAGSSKVGDGKSFTTADATVTVKLAEGSYKCAAVIDNGEISYVAVNADNTVTLSVEAYEGVFVIPVLN